MTTNDALSQAQNPATSPTVLAALYNHPHLSVRRAVAQHPQTPTEALHHLSVDPDWNVRRSLLNHPNLEQSVLERLSLDPDPEIRENAEDFLRFRTRQTWTEQDAERALEAARKDDLIALEQVETHLLERELADGTGSSFFVTHVHFPRGDNGPDRLREAVSYLTTAAEYGRPQARDYLDSVSREQHYSYPPTRGQLWVDTSHSFALNELLPSRIEVQLKGALIEGFNYINPSVTAAWLESLGFAWSDPVTVAQHFETWTDDEEGALKALYKWAEDEPFRDISQQFMSHYNMDEAMPIFQVIAPLDELNEFEEEAGEIGGTREGGLFQAALRYDLVAGWKAVEELSEQAETDEHAAMLCLALLRLYSGIGHARSSVTFRALVQLKAEYEWGGS